MTTDHLLVEIDGEGIATLLLNRPESLNAFSRELEEALRETTARLAADPSVRAVVLTGAGRAFCAGGDVKEMQRGGSWDLGREGREARFRTFHQIATNLQRMPQPTIAMINGVAVGAGCNLAMACDLRVAAEGARLGLAFRHVGLGDDLGGAWMLPRLVGMGKALELFLTGAIIDAGEALRIGLVNRVVAKEQLQEETHALARQMALGPAGALALIKESIYGGMNQSLHELLDLETSRQPVLMDEPDHAEGVAAFIEKREARYR